MAGLCRGGAHRDRRSSGRARAGRRARESRDALGGEALLGIYLGAGSSPSRAAPRRAIGWCAVDGAATHAHPISSRGILAPPLVRVPCGCRARWCATLARHATSGFLPCVAGACSIRRGAAHRGAPHRRCRLGAPSARLPYLQVTSFKGVVTSQPLLSPFLADHLTLRTSRHESPTPDESTDTATRTRIVAAAGDQTPAPPTPTHRPAASSPPPRRPHRC